MNRDIKSIIDGLVKAKNIGEEDRTAAATILGFSKYGDNKNRISGATGIDKQTVEMHLNNLKHMKMIENGKLLCDSDDKNMGLQFCLWVLGAQNKVSLVQK